MKVFCLIDRMPAGEVLGVFKNPIAAQKYLWEVAIESWLILQGKKAEISDIKKFIEESTEEEKEKIRLFARGYLAIEEHEVIE